MAFGLETRLLFVPSLCSLVPKTDKNGHKTVEKGGVA